MIRQDFNIALRWLERYILSNVKAINYRSSLKAPSSYKTMRSHYDNNGYFLVYSGASNGCIYSSNDINVAFRALHDSMHYKYKLKFNFEDEKKLSDITMRDAILWCYDNGATQFEAFNVGEIVEAEIKGQIEYYEEKGEYVLDQMKFMEDYLNIENV